MPLFPSPRATTARSALGFLAAHLARTGKGLGQSRDHRRYSQSRERFNLFADAP